MIRSPARATLRYAARTALAHAGDMFQPLTLLLRGSRRLATTGTSRFRALPRERRGQVAVGAAALLLVLYFLPFGLLAGCTALFVAALWLGRERRGACEAPAEPGPAAADGRLAALHRALVPHFAHPEDPAPLYSPHGSHADTFDAWEFDAQGRLARLELRYPDLFTDGEPADRARIERAIRAKAGRDRDYRFDWDPENARLHVTALAPLPTDIVAQRFVVPAGEIVLGFTDASSTERAIPVRRSGELRHAPPLTWRTGPRATEPHLLVLGSTGSGRSTLLRSVALQALQHGDVVVVDGSGTGDFACLSGRAGVQAVETTAQGAHDVLEWAAKEMHRRLAVINAAKRSGNAAPADARRPLWLLLDQPVELGEAARADGGADPQVHLDALLRYGRRANLTLAVAEDLAAHQALTPAVRQHCRARVLLGPAAADEAQAVLGTDAPATAAVRSGHGGRGWARIGARPCVRIQVPATPDPLDEDVPDDERTAVLELMPAPAPSEEDTPPHGVPVPEVPAAGPGAAREPAGVLEGAPAAREDLPVRLEKR